MLSLQQYLSNNDSENTGITQKIKIILRKRF